MKFRTEFRTRAVAAGFFVCLCLLPGACARRAEAPTIERLAVLRFENLGADEGADWMGRAFSEIVTAELTGAPGLDAIPASRLYASAQALGARPAGAPGISAEAPLALAAGANRIGYGQYYVQGQTLHATLTVEDPGTRRMVQVARAEAPAADMAGAAAALARQLWPQAPPYPVRNQAAIEAYAKAIEAADRNAEESLLRQAIGGDPDFGPAYVALADLKARERDRDGLAQALQAAAARGAELAPADRARLAVLSASVSGNRAAREGAFEQLARAVPNDPTAWRGLALAASVRHNYALAERAGARAVVLEPEDAAAWNQLAYSRAAAGDLPGAMAALDHYRNLRPGDPNAIDSMGDVNLIRGRLKEAERFYLDAAKMSPSFLNGAEFYKAAMARLMTGDVAGADGLYARYPGAGPHRAEWLWLSGRRREGYAALLAQADRLPAETRPNAYAELTIWSLLQNDGAAAARMAAKTGPNALGALARFLTLPAAQPAEWAARARRLFPGPSGDLALAYALLLHRQFPQAAEALRRVYDNSDAVPDSSTPVELAWALIESGDFQDAAPLLRANPAPSVAGPSALLSVSFPRIFLLRAELAEKGGRANEARANRHIFEVLSRE